MQRRCKHAFSTIERLCFLLVLCKVVTKKISVEKGELSFETPACQEMSWGEGGERFERVGGRS
jgi:hypothetical protein